MNMLETEQASLLAAIRAAPDDDVPRLVYADWLQERELHKKCQHCDGSGRIITGHENMIARSDYVSGVPFLRVHHKICEHCVGVGTIPDLTFARFAEFIRSAIAKGDDQAHSEFHKWCCYEGEYDFKPEQTGLPLGFRVSCLEWCFHYMSDNGNIACLTRRGFVERLSIPWVDWLASHEEILTSPTVVLRQVHLKSWPNEEWVAYMHGIDLSREWSMGPLTGPSAQDFYVLPALQCRFPGHCPNHLIEWVLPKAPAEAQVTNFEGQGS